MLVESQRHVCLGRSPNAVLAASAMSAEHTDWRSCHDWTSHRYTWMARLLRRARAGGTQVSYDGGIDTPPPPPPCPTGWRTGPPDFVGVGVQRCGSTRWFALIRTHPEVDHANRAKELHYFDRFYAGGFTHADAVVYHQYFPRRSGNKTGEWTPLYASAPWIPRLLATAAPHAQLLVLLRDPVERYLSALELNTRVAGRRGVPLSRYAPLEAFLRGLYHEQLSTLLNYFERSRVLVLQYERCTQDPRSELRRTYGFLGLNDTEFVPPLDAHPKRQPEKPGLDAGTRSAFVEAYRNDVLSLIEAFPEIDVTLWPNFAHLAKRSPTAV
jgi:Sulfotransferase domain